MNTWKINNIVAFVILITYCLFVASVLGSHNWDPKAFILERRPEVPLEQGWDIGYDAQWYFFIASDPLGAEKVLDSPAYRYQRIIYPMLVRVLSLGQVEWIPWTMLIVNLAAAGLCTFLLATSIAKNGGSPWFALTLCGSFGFLLAMRLDLLEPLTLVLAIAGWIMYKEGKSTRGILLFALSGLTKEIGLIFPVALSVWLLWRRQWRKAIWLAAGSILPYILWGVYLQSQFGTTSEAVEATRLSWIPFSGIFSLADMPSLLLVNLWVVLPALTSIGYIVYLGLFKHTGLTQPEALLVFAQVAFLSIMPHATWADPLAVIRTSSGFLAALILWLAIANRRLLPYTAALFLPSSLLAVFVPGFLSS